MYPQKSIPLRSADGFTLVELIVVVGLVGILSSIATANYQKFTTRARQTEAKIQLSAAYAAEKNIYTEHGSNTYCLYQAGYEPEAKSSRYYLIGFLNASTDAVCGPDGSSSCFKYSWNGSTSDCSCGSARVFWGGSERSDCIFYPNSTITPSTWTSFNSGPAWIATQNTFIIGAASSLRKASAVDVWTIDQNKTLINTQSGL